MTTVSGAPSSSSTRRTSAWASRSWMTSGLPYRFAIAMWARKLASWAPRPSGPVRYVSRPVSPIPRTRGWAARRSTARRASSRSGWRGASLGWIATVATTSGRRAARSTAHRDDATSTPTCTTRSTPTARAARRWASGSPPMTSRWVWLSGTGTVSGGGAGGGSPRSVRRPATPVPAPRPSCCWLLTPPCSQAAPGAPRRHPSPGPVGGLRGRSVPVRRGRYRQRRGRVRRGPEGGDEERTDLVAGMPRRSPTPAHPVERLHRRLHVRRPEPEVPQRGGNGRGRRASRWPPAGPAPARRGRWPHPSTHSGVPQRRLSSVPSSTAPR
jgi:hypothetical protein